MAVYEVTFPSRPMTFKLSSQYKDPKPTTRTGPTQITNTPMNYSNSQDSPIYLPFDY